MNIFQSREETRIQELVKLYRYWQKAGLDELDVKLTVAADLKLHKGKIRDRIDGLTQDEQIKGVKEWANIDVRTTGIEDLITTIVAWEFKPKYGSITAEGMANHTDPIDLLKLKVKKNLQ